MRNGLIIDKNGTKFWYKNDELHNENGPALEYTNGKKIWYMYNRRHRLDGPAVESPNEDKAWYYQGEYIDCDSQKEFERMIKLKGLWLNMKNGLIIYENGEYWFKNNLLHNKNGPAAAIFIEDQVDKFYFINGKLHRLDGPACIYDNEYKQYYIGISKTHIHVNKLLSSNKKEFWFYEGQYIECDSQEEFEIYIKLKVLN